MTGRRRTPNVVQETFSEAYRRLPAEANQFRDVALPHRFQLRGRLHAGRAHRGAGRLDALDRMTPESPAPARTTWSTPAKSMAESGRARQLSAQERAAFHRCGIARMFDREFVQAGLKTNAAKHAVFADEEDARRSTADDRAPAV
jgi:hypothetical protein